MSKPNLRLGDFGESKLLPKKIATTLAGTTRWIAPEVFDWRGGKGYSFEADIWSFGMLLYELMTLKIPFFETGLGEYRFAVSWRRLIPRNRCGNTDH